MKLFFDRLQADRRASKTIDYAIALHEAKFALRRDTDLGSVLKYSAPSCSSRPRKSCSLLLSSAAPAHVSLSQHVAWRCCQNARFSTCLCDARYFLTVSQHIVAYAFTGIFPTIAHRFAPAGTRLAISGSSQAKPLPLIDHLPSHPSMTTVVPPIPSRTRRPRKSSRKTKKLRRATILGSGTCVPSRVIENDYFSRELGIDTTPEWIESRIGIVSRFWAVEESSTDLAAGAAQRRSIKQD